MLKPEIIAMKKLIEECKQSEAKGVLAFIDVHHHSSKRGCFMYGPHHNIISSKHAEVRVLPKLISLMVKDMFRYQACRFKNQSYKENCARIFCEKEM